MSASGPIWSGAATGCRGVPRFELSGEAWFAMTRALAGEPGLAFVALWAEGAHVHALFHGGAPVIASVAVEAGLYAALSPARPGAALFERMVADLWGHQAADAVDVRPWLDHGVWPTLRPLSERPVPNAAMAPEPEVPEMLAGPGEAVGFGPVSPGLGGGPEYWVLHDIGGRVGQLEARLGFAHRGVLGLMRGKSAAGAARIVARADGAATVAHSVAFARAVESAAEVAVPVRAVALREVALAVERVAVGLHRLDRVARALGGGWPALQVAREGLLEACGLAFGHRLMMDAVRPGGIGDVTGLEVVDAALAAVPGVQRRWPTVGRLPITEALRLGVGGAAGQASGRMDPIDPAAPIRPDGDLAARMALLSRAIEADVAAARALLAGLPGGEASVPLPIGTGEGVGVAIGPLGAVWHWVRMTNGVVAASFAADPGWLLVAALERAAPGVESGVLRAVVASFGVGVGGIDL